MSIRNLLNKIWPKFQPAYDSIKAWKLSPQLEQMLDDVWDNLPQDIQKAAYGLLKACYDKWGADLAKDLLARLLVGLKNK